MKLTLIGTGVRHWSMTSPEEGIYIMTKEQTTNIPVAFSDMSEELLPYIRFYFNLGVSIKNNSV